MLPTDPSPLVVDAVLVHDDSRLEDALRRELDPVDREGARRRGFFLAAAAGWVVLWSTTLVALAVMDR